MKKYKSPYQQGVYMIEVAQIAALVINLFCESHAPSNQDLCSKRLDKCVDRKYRSHEEVSNQDVTNDLYLTFVKQCTTEYTKTPLNQFYND